MIYAEETDRQAARRKPVTRTGCSWIMGCFAIASDMLISTTIRNRQGMASIWYGCSRTNHHRYCFSIIVNKIS